MKIWIDCRIYGPQSGSVGRYAELLVRYIDTHDTGHEYILWANRPTVPDVSRSNIRVVTVDVSIGSLREQTVFAREVYRSQCDLVHFLSYRMPVGYLRPYIVTIHDLVTLLYPDVRTSSSISRIGYRHLIRSVTRHAGRIIVPSLCTQHDLITHLNVHEDRISIIPHGIDRTSMHRPVSALALAQVCDRYRIRRDYILSVGTIRSHKNLPRLIEAYAKILRETPDYPYDLIIVGREDVDYPDIRTILAQSRDLLAGRVLLLGTIDDSDLIALYTRARALVAPSLYEGFGFSIVEAMEMGIPVACSDTPAHTEIVGEGRGVIFGAMDEDAIRRAILSITMNETIRTRVIAGAHEQVTCYDREVMGQAHTEVYENFLRK